MTNFYKAAVHKLFELNGVPKDKLDECIFWAFGEDAYVLPLNKWPGRWNDLHGEMFILNPESSPAIEFPKVARVYLNRKD